MQHSLRENIRVAVRAVKGQKLRTTLTVSIIAIGIMALVGILTAIQALKTKINEDFSDMGANTFTLLEKRIDVSQRKGKKVQDYERIDFTDAKRFTKSYDFPATVSRSVEASRQSQGSYRSKKTDPNIRVIGGDVPYIRTSGHRIERGRNFSPKEVRHGESVIILGMTIVKDLFRASEKALGKRITMDGRKYRVIGILQERGSTMGFSGNARCILPISTVKEEYGSDELSYKINVRTDHPDQLKPAILEAKGEFRRIRGDSPGSPSTFDIVMSDDLASRLIDQLRFITVTATIMGVVTLIGAAIGLMNIMLVSVTERTREIGTRKAMGADQFTIRRQFLIESVLIGQMGGAFGVILGMLAGNTVSLYFGGQLFVPWDWMIGGVIICLFVGILSGYYPARKAARLDPIEALRHE
ncbi:MAG: ABC transporter permease [Flavobacteriales bacterium]